MLKVELPSVRASVDSDNLDLINKMTSVIIILHFSYEILIFSFTFELQNFAAFPIELNPRSTDL